MAYSVASSHTHTGNKLCLSSRPSHTLRLVKLRPAQRQRRSVGLPVCCSRKPVLAVATEVLPEVSKPDAADEPKSVIAKDVEEDDFEAGYDGLDSVPSTVQVQNFLQLLCEETDIAEVELKMGEFEMKVRRSVSGGQSAQDAGVLAIAHPPPLAAPAPVAPATPAAEPAAPEPEPYFEDVATAEDDKENVLFIASPKVGVLQRSRLVKGVFGRKLVKEGDKIKKGQVLCFVKQMGNQVPVKSPQAGELLRFLVEDGDNVEYRQDIVELAPFFGGHIIGDSKHA